MWRLCWLIALWAFVTVVLSGAKHISSPLAKEKFSTGSHQNEEKAHLPWFYDADKYWDFNDVLNYSVFDIQHAQSSRIVGRHRFVPGPKHNPALELLPGNFSSHVILGDFTNTCLPNPQQCHRGFTICFWVNLRKVLNDGVLFQLSLNRRSQGITVNTVFKNRRVLLNFFVNNATAVHRIRTKFTSNVWHHVEMVWNATAEQKLAVFVNCSRVGKRMKVMDADSSKGVDKTFILGANHAGKKATPIAVDDFAIWFKSLHRQRLCEIITEKRVHGNYSSWSTFSPCSSPCGSGTRTRTRFCNNPHPDYGGRDCSFLGSWFESELCNENPCAVAGGYTQWSNFSRCSLSCGGGTRYRTRNCTNPTPQHGGDNCSRLGKSLHDEDCNTKPCSVDGNYSTWSGFSPCSTWCGNGQQVRNRSCTEPEPQFGGRNCSTLGLNYEVRMCNLRPCPVDGVYSEWSSFTSCSASCGYATKTRNRTCTNPEPSGGGNNCSVHGPRTEMVLCNNTPCPIHGNYSEWSGFTPCDKTCGNGSKIRRRYCTNPEPRFGGRQCSSLGSDAERASCNQSPCPVHGNFSEWSRFSECTSTCGNSTRMRTRNCTNPFPMHGGNNCSSLGPHVQVISCEVSPCPVDGNYSEWSKFTSCSKTCGTGSQLRNRTCANPTPRFGGKDCKPLGPSNETRECSPRPCPVHGNYTQWSQFAVCSTTCGPGVKTRHRSCTKPKPKFGGDDCLKLGSAAEAVPCNVKPCPVHGNYSEWSEFTSCSKTCGTGSQLRNRTCANPTPRFGGKDCKTLGPSNETRECSPRPCPVHGNYTQWSQFAVCSTTCGPGVKTRHRSCTKPKPKFGGDDCSKLGFATESVPCNEKPCPVHGNYSAWAPFGPCSKSCENGTQVRRRHCNSPLPRYGGWNCSTLGPSVERRWCEVQACPDIDFRINFELKDEKWNDDLLDMSSRRYQILRSELQNTIFGLYEKNIIKQVNVLKFSKGSVIAVMEVIFLSRYYGGVTELYDAFYASRRIGSYNVTPINFTSTDVPFVFPQNFTAFNRSSTSLALRWSPVYNHLTNGNMWGYAVTYTELWAGGTKTKYIYKVIFSNATAGNLHKLEKYSWYSVRIAAINRRGVGIPSASIVVLTDEDVPNASPNLKPFGYNTSSTSLIFSWKAIAKDDINGILLRYCIFYKTLTDNVIHLKTVPPTNLSCTLNKLRKYTQYEIRVAGVTSKGVGGKSEKAVISTDENVPDEAPKFHSCLNESSTAIKLQWYEIPKHERNGVLLRYTIFYQEAAFPNRIWKEIDNINATKTTEIIRKLKMFTEYSFEISAFTKKGGVRSGNIVVSTDEDIPCAPPLEVRAFNTSSTSLWLQWHALSVLYTRGILRSYVVFYKDNSKLRYQKITVPPTNTTLDITGLRKFTVYNISVAGQTSKGLGPLSAPITVSTAEDVPSMSPVSIQAFNTSSTTIHIVWRHIPESFLHGILRGYRIYWRKLNETMIERNVTVSSLQLLSFRISGLLKFTKYVVRIVGFTSMGSGLASAEVTVSTDEDVPSRIPPEFMATTKESPTTIPLAWRPIKDSFYIHGILLGYKIQFELTHIAGVPLNYPVNKTQRIFGPDTLTYMLMDLEIYAKYRIKIWAFTRIGDGPSSENVAETCNCRSSLQTNWWINPPYIYKTSTNISGIFPAIIPRMVSSCCGFCREHNLTVTSFENDKDASLRFLKPGVSDFRDSIDGNTDLHFPMYGQIYQVKYSKRYEFIPLVESPGVIFLVPEDEPGKATRLLLNVLWRTIPVTILMFVLVWLFALLVWFADNLSNSDHFPSNFFAGVYEGIWWSFITMTSVGYGDRFPRSVAARLVAVLWILTGMILVALYTSVVSSNITTGVVSTRLKLYGTKVAAIHNSSEHRLAVRKNGKLDLERPYNNLYDIYDSLSKRLVQGALIDAYVLGSRRDLFAKISVRINRIYDYSSAYGVVLAGEATKLQKCFREHVKAEQKQIFKIIEENVDSIEEDAVSQSVRRAQSIIDPSFIVYKECLFASIIVLSVAATLCSVFELIRKPLKKRFFRSKKTCNAVKLRNHMRSVQKSLQLELQEYMQTLNWKLEKLKRKHVKELKQLSKLKKSLPRLWSEDSLIFSTSVIRYDEAHKSPTLPLKKLIDNYKRKTEGKPSMVSEV